MLAHDETIESALQAAAHKTGYCITVSCSNPIKRKEKMVELKAGKITGRSSRSPTVNGGTHHDTASDASHEVDVC